MKIKDFFTVEKDPEIVPIEHFFERFRNWRKNELNQSDWTQLPDSVCDKLKWAEYRQVLRDLPAQSNFENLELPVKP